jgi:tellurite resistance protein TerC
MRLLLILAGSWLIIHFHWLLYVMGVFLLLTGIKMLYSSHEEKNLRESMTFRFLQRFFRITNEFHDQHFFVRENLLLCATPLFVALIFIEISDLIFALDSIPAIFAITTDPFIVWSSNIFAILGLRAMYFLLAGMISRFSLLKYGIALILVFVGAKMIVAPWIVIPVEWSLLVILGILVVFCGLNYWMLRRAR